MKEDKGKENLSKGDELSHLDPEWIKKGLHSNDICLNWVKRFAYHLAVSSMKEDKRDHVQEMANQFSEKNYLQISLENSLVK
jgi:hypothetical protein